MGLHGVKSPVIIQLLNLLPDPCAPTTEQVRKISRQVKCTENWVWKTLSHLRKTNNWSSLWSLNEDLKTSLHVLYRVMDEKMKFSKPISKAEKSTIEHIEKILEIKTPESENRKILEEDYVMQKLKEGSL